MTYFSIISSFLLISLLTYSHASISANMAELTDEPHLIIPDQVWTVTYNMTVQDTACTTASIFVGGAFPITDLQYNVNPVSKYKETTKFEFNYTNLEVGKNVLVMETQQWIFNASIINSISYFKFFDIWCNDVSDVFGLISYDKKPDSIDADETQEVKLGFDDNFGWPCNTLQYTLQDGDSPTSLSLRVIGLPFNLEAPIIILGSEHKVPIYLAGEYASVNCTIEQVELGKCVLQVNTDSINNYYWKVYAANDKIKQPITINAKLEATFPSVSTGSSGLTTGTGSPHHGMSPGSIAGLVIGLLILLGAVVGGVLYYMRRRQVKYEMI